MRTMSEQIEAKEPGKSRRALLAAAVGGAAAVAAQAALPLGAQAHDAEDVELGATNVDTTTTTIDTSGTADVDASRPPPAVMAPPSSQPRRMALPSRPRTRTS
jgi:hypothetical protein